MGEAVRAVLLGDSQGEGLEPLLAPVLRRHGYHLDTPASWTQSGASIAAIAAHTSSAGPADLVLVVSGGGNDTVGADYAGKLAAVAAQLRAGGARDVVWVGPMRSDDPRVRALHDAARAVQGRGIRGARWIDGYALSGWAEHGPDGTHFTPNGYRSIALELERAVWSQDQATVIGLVGTLAFLGACGVILTEALYARATVDDR